MRTLNNEVDVHILNTIKKDGSATYTSISKGLSAKTLIKYGNVGYRLQYLLAQKAIEKSKHHSKRYVLTGLNMAGESETVEAKDNSEIVEVDHTYQPISGRDYVFVGVLAMSVAAITTTLLELL